MLCCLGTGIVTFPSRRAFLVAVVVVVVCFDKTSISSVSDQLYRKPESSERAEGAESGGQPDHKRGQPDRD